MIGRFALIFFELWVLVAWMCFIGYMSGYEIYRRYKEINYHFSKVNMPLDFPWNYLCKFPENTAGKQYLLAYDIERVTIIYIIAVSLVIAVESFLIVFYDRFRVGYCILANQTPYCVFLAWTMLEQNKVMNFDDREPRLCRNDIKAALHQYKREYKDKGSITVTEVTGRKHLSYRDDFVILTVKPFEKSEPIVAIKIASIRKYRYCENEVIELLSQKTRGR